MSGTIEIAGNSRSLSGSLNSTSTSAWFTPSAAFYMALYGTWAGDVTLEATPDNGVTVIPCTSAGVPVTFTQPCLESVSAVADRRYKFRINFQRTSGTLFFRLSQTA